MGQRLTSRHIPTAAPGKYADGGYARGGNLYLVVAPSGSRKWIFRYRLLGRSREMGLGPARSDNLADARRKSDEARRLVLDGVDPIDARRKEQVVPSFGPFAIEVIQSLAAGFRNEKHKAQWRSTIAHYAKPLWNLRLNQIETSHVLSVLKPIWTTKSETANRLRGRIEKILDAASARGFRAGDNPARWRGHMDHLLPRMKSSRHHKAMPYRDLPAFMTRLRKRKSVAALALEFCILCAARSGEVTGATWNEIDFARRVWTIPAHRMKANREHSVALSDQAMTLLKNLQETRTGPYIFPGQTLDNPLSDMAFGMLLRRMKETCTTHGFRSSFRDWAGDETTYPRELAEQAIAHVIGDKAEQAYRRSDALERRRALMADWAACLDEEASAPLNHS